MTPEQVRLIQTSFALVLRDGTRTSNLFYSRLFELDPSLRPLFRGDLEAQGRKFIEMLDVTMGDLTRLETILPAVRRLGQRHREYGVLDAHYDTVGGALLWALQETLQEHFTPEVFEAWASAYTLVANTMKAAAREASSGIDLQ